MINKTLLNKNLQQNQHELFIINKLKKLSNLSQFSDSPLKIKNKNGGSLDAILHAKHEELHQGAKAKMENHIYSSKKKDVSGFNQPFLKNQKIKISSPLKIENEGMIKKTITCKLLTNNNIHLPFVNGDNPIPVSTIKNAQFINKLVNTEQTKHTTFSLGQHLNQRIFFYGLKKANQRKWFNYFFYNNPINLLFSIDQFLFELAKKQPQRRKSSEFQQQLKERKKLSIFYGHLSKKQLKNLLSQSKSSQGYFSLYFFSILERRLDVLLYRSGLVKNILTARQLISHKKIMVNNQFINIASYQVNPGDIISIKSNKKNEIISPLKEIIQVKFKKRRYHLTIPENFIYKIQNIRYFKNYTPKKTLKNYIRLLLAKVDKRALLKINISASQFSIFASPLKMENREPKIENLGIFFKNNTPGSFLHSKKDTSSNLLNTKDDFFYNVKKANAGEHFTVLKLKPLLSKHAKFFLLTCIQKNYLSLNRKPFFENKYIRFINLLEKYVKFNLSFASPGKAWREPRSNLKNLSNKSKNFNKENTPKNNNFGFFIKDKKISQNPKQSNALKSFTRKLYISTYIQKNVSFLNSSFSSIYNKKRNSAIYRNIVYKTILQMHSDFLYSPFSIYNGEPNASFCIKNGEPGILGNKPVSFLYNKKESTLLLNTVNSVSRDTGNPLSRNTEMSKKKIINTLLTLKLKKHITKKQYPKQRKKALRICIIKPMHIEVSYSMSTAILLYSPQRLSFPFYINLDLVSRSFH